MKQRKIVYHHLFPQLLQSALTMFLELHGAGKTDTDPSIHAHWLSNKFAKELETSFLVLLMRALHYKVLRGYFNLLGISRWKTTEAIFKRLFIRKEKAQL